MRTFGVAAVLSILLTGCGTLVTNTMLNPPPRPLDPKGAAAVEVYASAPPSRPHVDVSLLEVEQTTGDGNDAMIWRLRERAGAMGCDAIYLGGIRDRHAPGFADAAVFNATCVVYTDVAVDASRNPAAAPAITAPPPAIGDRRMCRDRADFDRNRNCVLPAGAS